MAFGVSNTRRCRGQPGDLLLPAPRTSMVILTATRAKSFTVQSPFVKTADILFVPDAAATTLHAFRPYYTNALDAEGYAYDIWDTGRRCAPDSTILNQYTAGTVVWAAPYYRGYITDDGNQRTAVQNYLDAGGKLFVTGQDVAYSTQGTSFLGDYLHAAYVQYDSGLRTVYRHGVDVWYCRWRWG